MRWFLIHWHTCWFNLHIQMYADAIDSDERSRQQMRMRYHESKLVKLLCD